MKVSCYRQSRLFVVNRLNDARVFQVALLDLQSNSKIAALLPYFVYVISGVSFRVTQISIYDSHHQFC